MYTDVPFLMFAVIRVQSVVLCLQTGNLRLINLHCANFKTYFNAMCRAFHWLCHTGSHFLPKWLLKSLFFFFFKVRNCCTFFIFTLGCLGWVGEGKQYTRLAKNQRNVILLQEIIKKGKNKSETLSRESRRFMKGKGINLC